MQQIMYILLVSQKGEMPSMRSLSVPPPMAVAIPTISAPNKSKRRADAIRIPLMANAIVPTHSMMTNDAGIRSAAPNC